MPRNAYGKISLIGEFSIKEFEEFEQNFAPGLDFKIAGFWS